MYLFRNVDCQMNKTTVYFVFICVGTLYIHVATVPAGSSFGGGGGGCWQYWLGWGHFPDWISQSILLL